MILDRDGMVWTFGWASQVRTCSLGVDMVCEVVCIRLGGCSW